MPKSRKTKSKYKDFQKVKLKVGKTLPKGQNETTTSFKSRSIHLKEQLSSTSGEPTTRRKLSVKDLLTQCAHYSASVRLDAVTGLRELLAANPSVLDSHMAVIIHRVAELCLDKDATVRQGLLRLLKHVMPTIPSNQIAPFFPLLSTHLCCAMTHIHDDIQLDSLALLDLCLENYPALVTDRSSNLLPNFIEQISRQNQTGSGKSNSDVVSRSLLVNPNSRLSSHKWRIKVLGRLNKFLQAVVDQMALRSGVDRSTGAPSSGCHIHWSSATEGISILPSDAVSCALGQGFKLSHASDSSTSVRSSDSPDAFTSVEQLKSFTEIIIPLLIQCWMEAGPSQLTSKLPGNALGADALAMLSGVLGVLKLLLQCVRHHSNTPGLQLVGWMKERYERDFVQHLLPSFPYEMHQQARSKNRGAKSKVDTAHISTLSLNLSVCEIMSNFLEESGAVSSARSKSPKRQDHSGAWVNRLTGYITQTLKEQRISGDDLSSALKFVMKLIDLPENTGIAPGVLEGVYVCYMSKNVTSSDKRTLLDFYTRILQTNSLEIIRSEPVQKWMQSLPRLLTAPRSGSNRGFKVSEVIIKVMQKVGVQGHGAFLLALQENSVDIFDELLRVDSSDELKRATLELVQILPEIHERHLQQLTRSIFSESLSLKLTQYLVDIIMHRFNRYSGRHGDSCLATEDLISFLFTLVLGTTSAELGQGEGILGNNRVTIATDLDAIRCWKYRTMVAKIGRNAVNQLSNSQQVWDMFAHYSAKLPSRGCSLPVYTAQCLLEAQQHVQHTCPEPRFIAHCTHSLVLKSATLCRSPPEGAGEVESLCACARTTCFNLLAGSPKIRVSFWACVMEKLKTEACVEQTLHQCTWVAAMFDHVELMSNVNTWISAVRGIIQQAQAIHGEELDTKKEWNELLYKVSLVK